MSFSLVNSFVWGGNYVFFRWKWRTRIREQTINSKRLNHAVTWTWLHRPGKRIPWNLPFLHSFEKAKSCSYLNMNTKPGKRTPWNLPFLHSVHTVVGTQSRERTTTASKNKEQPLVVFFCWCVCTTHLVYAVDKETLQERIRVLFFSGLVSLIAKVAAIRKLATPSRN